MGRIQRARSRSNRPSRSIVKSRDSTSSTMRRRMPTDSTCSANIYSAGACNESRMPIGADSREERIADASRRNCTQIQKSLSYQRTHTLPRALLYRPSLNSVNRLFKLPLFLSTPRSMSSRDPKLSYVGVTFQSRLVVDWLAQLRTIVVRCATRLRDLRPEYVAEGKRITRSLLVLITFTSTGKSLCSCMWRE